ncbi:BQ5605_C001g00519 [Microbotryum silenes-dioicae]|uniref:BQ5605_C001g00519 protein n=1 Tax=Microbotryum silenes-dioicae TaxID=796604 RepID=A0A2X0M6Y5_9BASI|nr:BQ5605_C001g00519 [Microbotryum silenes-dioicae]
MVEVKLHPVAQRSKPGHAAAAAQEERDAILATPLFPHIETLIENGTNAPTKSAHPPSSVKMTTRPASSPIRHSSLRAAKSSSSSSSNSTGGANVAPVVTPRHGLQIDATHFPLLSTRNNVPPIRVLTADDYARLQATYSKQRLPEDVLFPWSHGSADIPHSAASQYFGFAKGTAARAPSYRGLTTVHCPPPVTPCSTSAPSRRRGLISSFASWSTNSSTHSSSSSVSSTSSEDSSSSSASASPSPSLHSATPTCRLVSSLPLSSIISASTNSFALPAPETFQTVNLRHFALQAAKYATISDIVVYGENGAESHVIDAAARVAEAQERERRRRGGDAAGAIQYNVYIIVDPFVTFEQRYPTIVGIDSNGFVRNKLNFFEREREEMRVLTQASEILHNVWLGNAQDVPQAPYAQALSNDSSSSLLDDGNPLSFSICIEAHDQAANVSAAILRDADRNLNDLEAQGQAYEEVRQLLDDEIDTTASQLGEERVKILRPHVHDLVHFECPSTSTNCVAPNSSSHTTKRAQTQFVNALVELAVWMRRQACPDDTSRLPRRILLHCGDGYTESSLLAVTYVMVAGGGRNAAEAYLYLQESAQRSFYIYPQDYQLLPMIERRVIDVLCREEQEWLATRKSMSWQLTASPMAPSRSSSVSSINGGGEEPTSTGMERSDSGYVSNSSTPTKTSKFVQAVRGALSSSSSNSCDDAEMRPRSPSPDAELAQQWFSSKPRPSNPSNSPWFYAPVFDGHFPSRILPFLYLGNLNHANNALMLKELGITHVVSMGESALTPPRPPPVGAAGSNETHTNSLWLEERLGNISVLDMKNVADDGIDSIRPYIDQALEFIDQARWTGGKVLVHCRVGVSRSASIVIAYLMKHIELDLASAYLLTRSRRLNILIQPNLPFFATLHTFEADLLADKDGRIARREIAPDDDSDQHLGRAGLKRSNRVAWSYLCSSVASLNERFLC